MCTGSYTIRKAVEKSLGPIDVGECSALWGEREGVVWCISVPYTLTFPTCIYPM